MIPLWKFPNGPGSNGTSHSTPENPTQSQTAHGCTRSLNLIQSSGGVGRSSSTNWHRHTWDGKRESRKARSGQFGQWRDLQDDRGLESFFNGGECAFDRSTNQLYHARKFIFVEAETDVTDYSPKFKAAFELLRHSGGGTVVVGEGNFPLSKQLKIPSYCCMQGKGPDQTILRASNIGSRWRNRWRSPPIAVVEMCEVERVSLFDLTIDGGEDVSPSQRDVGDRKKDVDKREARNLLALSGVCSVLSNYVWIRGVRVSRVSGDGVGLHGKMQRWSFFADVEDCIAEQCAGSGFFVQRCFYVSVRRCVATVSGRNGVSIEGGARVVLISNGRFQNCGEADGCGVGVAVGNAEDIGEAKDIMIVGNCMNDCPGGAVRVRGAENVRERGNAFGRQGTRATVEEKQ